MNISYDRQTDVLYLRLDDVAGDCDYIEPTAGAVLRVERKTGRIVGCTIVAFNDASEKMAAFQSLRSDLSFFQPPFVL